MNKELSKKTKILKLTILIVAVLGVGVFALSGEAQAANWYANSNCTNDGNGTAATCAASTGGAGAKKVLENAIWASSSGDTVIAVDGIYTAGYGDESYILTYVNKSNVTIKSQNKGKAILDCGDRTVGGNKRGFHFSEHTSNVLIEGFEIRNCAYGVIINAYNNYLTVKNNLVHAITQAIYAGETTNYVTMDGNEVYDFGIVGSNQYHGLYAKGSNGTIINNIIYGNSGGGVYLQMGSYGAPTAGDFLIANNTFIGATNYAGQIITYGVTNFSSMNIVNNISSGHIHLFYDYNNSSSSLWNFKNNLTNNSTDYICKSLNGSYCATAVFSNNITGDPLFINAGDHNFQLSAGSPAINAGETLAAVATDHDGVLRLQGGRYDIGAYEYISEPSTYYIDDSGDRSDSYDGSINKPWATFAHAMTKLKPGDTLLIKDGTYTESLNVTKSGTSGNPITIKALNDGMAIVDRGSNPEFSLNVTGNYINVKGIQFKQNGGISQRVGIVDGSIGVKVSRCSFHDATGSATDYTMVHVISPATNLSEAVIFEDNIFTGYHGHINAQSSNYAVFRRNYFRGGYAGVYLYHCNNCISENNITYGDKSPTAGGNNGVQSNTSNRGDNNKIYGTIVYGNGTSSTTPYNGMTVMSRSPFYQRSGNDFKDNVSINTRYYGGFFESGNSLNVTNNTIVWTANLSQLKGLEFRRHSTCQLMTDPVCTNAISAMVKNNSIFDSTNTSQGLFVENVSYVTVANSYNNYYLSSKYGGKASIGTGEISITPSYNTITYGNGAYLMVPTALQGQGEGGADIGAEVLYQYENGILTSNPLWPWPMEARICAETGYSVTYENSYSGCANGGGLWKTLDGVYNNSADVNEDSRVNIKDIQAVIRCIINIQGCEFPDRSDVNGDGSVNIQDIQAVIREIVGS